MFIYTSNILTLDVCAVHARRRASSRESGGRSSKVGKYVASAPQPSQQPPFLTFLLSLSFSLFPLKPLFALALIKISGAGGTLAQGGQVLGKHPSTLAAIHPLSLSLDAPLRFGVELTTACYLLARWWRWTGVRGGRGRRRRGVRRRRVTRRRGEGTTRRPSCSWSRRADTPEKRGERRDAHKARTGRESQWSRWEEFAAWAAVGGQTHTQRHTPACRAPISRASSTTGPKSRASSTRTGPKGTRTVTKALHARAFHFTPQHSLLCFCGPYLGMHYNTC